MAVRFPAAPSVQVVHPRHSAYGLNIYSPSGVRVPVEAALPKEKANDFDTRLEVADPYCNLPPRLNNCGYRAANGVNYSEYGYILIGNCWVDPKNQEDVAIAKTRVNTDRHCPYIKFRGSTHNRDCIREPNITHIRAPDGTFIHVEKAIEKGNDFRKENDIRTEVAAPNQPLHRYYNSIGFRAAKDVDYDEYGYVKIGNYWVDSKNAEDVKMANLRADLDAEPWTQIAKLIDGCCCPCVGNTIRWLTR